MGGLDLILDAPASSIDRIAAWSVRSGMALARYGLVAILLWIGGMKFTVYEAEGIQLFVSNSPFFSWMTPVFGVRGASAIIGLAEIGTGIALALHAIAPRIGAIGALMATGTFIGTLSFMVTTPGVIEPSLGFPALSVVPGQFLVKDLALLAVSLLCVGESLNRAYGASKGDVSASMNR